MAFAPSTTTASRTGSPDWITASVFWMLGLEIEGDLRLAHQVARRVDEGACPRDLDLHRLELAYLGACIRADACPERGGDVLQRAFRRAERASRRQRGGSAERALRSRRRRHRGAAPTTAPTIA